MLTLFHHRKSGYKPVLSNEVDQLWQDVFTSMSKIHFAHCCAPDRGLILWDNEQHVPCLWRLTSEIPQSVSLEDREAKVSCLQRCAPGNL